MPAELPEALWRLNFRVRSLERIDGKWRGGSSQRSKQTSSKAASEPSLAATAPLFLHNTLLVRVTYL